MVNIMMRSTFWINMLLEVLVSFITFAHFINNVRMLSFSNYIILSALKINIWVLSTIHVISLTILMAVKSLFKLRVAQES